jgi:glycosyltransferase involved in cell wall biosynthesis
MKNGAPLVSVIIPYYNHGKFLLEAIESVEKLENKELYELIIVNDGSTDPESLAVIENLDTKKYTVISQKNAGLAAARNRAIAEARGKYILALDSDNRIKPEYITESISIMEANPDIGVVYGNPIVFGDLSIRGKWRVYDYSKETLFCRNYIDACAVFRKALWEKVGGYDGTMPWLGHEDWHLWIKFSALNVTFHHINKDLYYYRIVKDSMLSQVAKRKYLENFAHIIKNNADVYADFIDQNNKRFIKVSTLSKKQFKVLKVFIWLIKVFSF